MRSLWLAIDATSPRSSAALAEGGRLLAEAHGAAGDARSGRGGSNARSLLELVDDCFRSSGRDFGGVEAVVAVNGPGSFTGVRITLATAMGLVPEGQAGARLLAISSLAALALQAPADATCVVALVDALRGEWYRQRFERDTAAGELRPRGEAQRAALEESGRTTVTIFLGGAEVSGPRLSGRVVQGAPLSAAVATAASTGEAAALLVPSLAPLYLRAPAVTPPRSFVG